MIKNLKNKLKRLPFFESIYDMIRKIKLKRWKRDEKKVPVPNVAKVEIIKEYADKFDVKIFVETGTFMGDTVWALRKKFKKMFTIEIDDKLYIRAKENFSKFSHIEVIHGDSGEKIGSILENLDERVLFWLDGHYSAGITSKGSLDTPIKKELDEILNHSVKNHILLIDDARCFDGTNDYPTIEELDLIIKQKNKKYVMEIEDDIIRIILNENN